MIIYIILIILLSIYPKPNAIKNEANIMYLATERSYNHEVNLFKSTVELKLEVWFSISNTDVGKHALEKMGSLGYKQTQFLGLVADAVIVLTYVCIEVTEVKSKVVDVSVLTLVQSLGQEVKFLFIEHATTSDVDAGHLSTHKVIL